MINRKPTNWVNDDSLEMLFLFYQISDELLSEVSPDTYSLPQHNTLTLFSEIQEIYFMLKRHGIVEQYYSQYIPPIIDELLSNLEDDYILKQVFGKRLFCIRTGFEEAKTNHQLLERWMEMFQHSCSVSTYRKKYTDEIRHLITSTKDKKKLLYCTKNYYVCLVHLGYSREYLYTTAKRFFDNKDKAITQSNQISDYLRVYTCKRNEYNFLVFMDIEAIEYLDSISDNLIICKQISKVDIASERDELCKDDIVSDLFREYDTRLRTEKKHSKLAIVRFTDDSLDPYTAALDFDGQIRFLQSFSRYFKHFYYSKQIYRMLLKGSDGQYHDLKIPNRYQKRPFIPQDVIDGRVKNILHAKSMSMEAFQSIAHAFEMHAEAFDSRNAATLLRTFWTAIETLFSNPSASISRRNVIDCVLPIIQKTYILKKLRLLFSQLESAIDSEKMAELNIGSFLDFIRFFSSNEENSDEMKKIYACLSENILLRSRLFETRKEMRDGNSIGKLLDIHYERVHWQLKRIYRNRNIATHLGYDTSGSIMAINHLHNYFDYIVNYMLCKSENSDWIESTTAVVFEAENDNRIQRELLKTSDKLSQDNYMDFLFGPDMHLSTYKFEY